MTNSRLDNSRIFREYTIKLRVTEEEREQLRRAAKQAGWSVRVWAEVNLVTLAEVELNNDEARSAVKVPAGG